MKSAITTVINSLTSNTTVGVSYDSHTTDFQIFAGMPLHSILNRMGTEINNNLNAHITAEVDIVNNTITFMQKEGASGSYVNIQVNFNDWQNGQPFSPMNPDIS